jgi:hypothetical protein
MYSAAQVGCAVAHAHVGLVAEQAPHSRGLVGVICYDEQS